MKAIILSAGQGSRLLPLTNDMPKCLLPVGKKTTLQWQVEALDRAEDVKEIVVVIGFMAEKVEAALEAMSFITTPITTVYNPFYNVADNLGSCWMARHHMNEDFLILNGDSLIEYSILPRVLEIANAPINLTINYKDGFDSDDMKVTLNGANKVEAVGKTLMPRETHAESIGLVVFKNEGRAAFRKEVENSMRDGSGLQAWYLQVIDRLAKRGLVGSADIGSLEWGEIDFPSDLDDARAMTAAWDRLRIVA